MKLGNSLIHLDSTNAYQDILLYLMEECYKKEEEPDCMSKMI